MASYPIISRDEALALPVDYVKAYLLSRGWSRDSEASWSSGSVYRLGEGEVIVPTRSDLTDYFPRIVDAVLALAELEKRHPRHVFHDMSCGQSSDILRFRQLSSSTKNGAIPLEEGVLLFQSIRDSVSAAAHSAIHPKGYYNRLGLKKVDDLLGQCRLGQTERGSFTASIMIPVPPAISSEGKLFPELKDENEVEPLARKTSRLLMVALATIRNGMDSDKLDGVLNGVNYGISGNLCEAFEKLLTPVEMTAIEVSVGWARSRPIASNVIQQVTFCSSEKGLFSAIAKQFREKTNLEDQVRGKIVSLKGDITLLKVGHIAIKSDTSSHQVLCDLNREQYTLAIDAYRDGKTVIAKGKLIQDGKTQWIENLQDFQIIE